MLLLTSSLQPSSIIHVKALKVYNTNPLGKFILGKNTLGYILANIGDNYIYWLEMTYPNSNIIGTYYPTVYGRFILGTSLLGLTRIGISYTNATIPPLIPFRNEFQFGSIFGVMGVSPLGDQTQEFIMGTNFGMLGTSAIGYPGLHPPAPPPPKPNPQFQLGTSLGALSLGTLGDQSQEFIMGGSFGTLGKSGIGYPGDHTPTPPVLPNPQFQLGTSLGVLSLGTLGDIRQEFILGGNFGVLGTSGIGYPGDHPLVIKRTIRLGASINGRLGSNYLG